MICDACGKQYQRYKIEYTGTVYVEDFKLTLDPGRAEIRSENATVCADCVIKAFGRGHVTHGQVRIDTVWIEREYGALCDGDYHEIPAPRGYTQIPLRGTDDPSNRSGMEIRAPDTRS